MLLTRTVLMRPLRSRVVLPFLCLLGLWGGAAAQPYAAAGGFGRPEQQEARATAASVAVAVSPDGATTTTVWAGREGVWRADRSAAGTAAPVLVAASDDVRTVSAAYLGDELTVTWVTRDRRTGVYHYLAHHAGATRELFQDALIIDLTLFSFQGEAWAAGLFRRDGEGQLRLVPLAGGDDLVVYRTALTQRGLGLLPAADGVWFGWLEGKNERGEFGLVSEWDAFVGHLPAGAAALAGVVGLGEANVEDERQRVALLAPATADAALPAVAALWPDAEADLRLTELRAGADGPVAGAPSAPLGRGRPIGAAWPHVYWVTGGSVVRSDVAAREALNVAWSPVTIESAAFAADGGVEALAWFGRAQGGAIEVYATDDRTPIALGWRDRVAAAMGWSPWHMWDELFGQALTAVLVGVVFGVALVPLFLALAPLLARFVRRPRGAMVTGLVLGALPVVAAGVVYARSVGPAAGAEPDLLTVVAAALFGALVGWLFSRRGDREAQGTMTLAGAVTAFAGVTLWSFLTYKEWAPFIGLS